MGAEGVVEDGPHIRCLLLRLHVAHHSLYHRALLLLQLDVSTCIANGLSGFDGSCKEVDEVPAAFAGNWHRSALRLLKLAVADSADFAILARADPRHALQAMRTFSVVQFTALRAALVGACAAVGVFEALSALRRQDVALGHLVAATCPQGAHAAQTVAGHPLIRISVQIGSLFCPQHTFQMVHSGLIETLIVFALGVVLRLSGEEGTRAAGAGSGLSVHVVYLAAVLSITIVLAVSASNR